MASSSGVNAYNRVVQERRHLMKLCKVFFEEDPSSETYANIDRPEFEELLNADKQRVRELIQYIPLYKAALKGDWPSARRIFDRNPEAITSRITEDLNTALHIAVGTGKANDFVRNLIDLMPVEALEMTNDLNETALTVAAMVGNLEAAELLVERNPNLPYIRDNDYVVPVHRAARYGHKNLVSFLLEITRDDHLVPNNLPSSFVGESGLKLLILLVIAGFYDE